MAALPSERSANNLPLRLTWRSTLPVVRTVNGAASYWPDTWRPTMLRVGELGDTAVWVAMDDLADADRRPWSAEHFATAARHLGAFNGRFVDGTHPYAEGWLSRDWVCGWTRVISE